MVTPIVNIYHYPQWVPVLTGAPTMLVAQRELCGKYVKDAASLRQRKKKSEDYYTKRTGGYQVNPHIKTWSCFFLLKALTTSGQLYNWTSQKKYLLHWIQCNENTFRRLLSEMKRMQLCTVRKSDRTIILASYEKAAEVLDIPFNGTTQIKYSPDEQEGKQIFQHLIRAEEFRYEQQRQLDGLMYWLEKNPSLKNDLHLMLLKYGADDKQLRNARYFQERLLSLQVNLFKEGSDLLSYIFSRRADINRSCNLIKEHHKYKSSQSVSYLKQCMAKHKLITVTKVMAESTCRSRLYIEDGTEKRRDGYKWLGKKQATALVLTDQISFNYERKQPEKATAKRAA